MNKLVGILIIYIIIKLLNKYLILYILLIIYAANKYLFIIFSGFEIIKFYIFMVQINIMTNIDKIIIKSNQNYL